MRPAKMDCSCPITQVNSAKDYVAAKRAVPFVLPAEPLLAEAGPLRDHITQKREREVGQVRLLS